MTRLEQMERSIEAILFACGEPVECARIAEALETGAENIHRLVERIRDRYIAINSPLEIMLLDNAYQMCSSPEYGDIIRKTLMLRRGTGLSQAALEVLAVVAYNQPVTRAFIEQVRGVDCSSLVRSLVEKRLVEEAGRMNIPGKPIVYQTTSNFLRCFGLSSIEQLPTLPSVDDELADEEEQLEGQIDFFEDNQL